MKTKKTLKNAKRDLKRFRQAEQKYRQGIDNLKRYIAGTRYDAWFIGPNNTDDLDWKTGSGHYSQ